MNNFELQTVSKNIYKNNYGYFMFDKKTNSKWIFTPLEKQFDTDDLFAIMDILRNLNENEKSAQTYS